MSDILRAMARLVLLFTVAAALCLAGCDEEEDAAGNRRNDPYEAELAAIRQRITDLQREYEQNRAKLHVDLKSALDKAKTQEDSDAVLAQVVELTRVVASNTRKMQALTQQLHSQMRAAGIAPPEDVR